MSKLSKLQAAITELPDEHNAIRNTCLNLLDGGLLNELRIYTLGLRDMALHLTSDDQLLAILTKIREYLK